MSSAARVSSPSHRARCAIIVPFSTHIVPGCQQALIEWQRRGYEVWHIGGYSAIESAAAKWPPGLEAGFDETFWIDSDIEFEPDAVDRIRSHGLPICCGIYARKGTRAIAAHTLPGTAKLGMGKGTGLVEILYAGTGFLHVRREVYTAIREKLALPMCNAQFGRPMVPFFMPMIVDGAGQTSEVRTSEVRGQKSGVRRWRAEGRSKHARCRRARGTGVLLTLRRGGQSRRSVMSTRARGTGTWRTIILFANGRGSRLQDHGRHVDPPVAHWQLRLRLGKRRARTSPS